MPLSFTYAKFFIEIIRDVLFTQHVLTDELNHIRDVFIYNELLSSVWDFDQFSKRYLYKDSSRRLESLSDMDRKLLCQLVAHRIDKIYQVITKIANVVIRHLKDKYNCGRSDLSKIQHACLLLTESFQQIHSVPILKALNYKNNLQGELRDTCLDCMTECELFIARMPNAEQVQNIITANCRKHDRNIIDLRVLDQKIIQQIYGPNSKTRKILERKREDIDTNISKVKERIAELESNLVRYANFGTLFVRQLNQYNNVQEQIEQIKLKLEKER
ncbi:hypothetical protein GJ496_001720 [Pomphorhynchus laevis]|nr:hypothetical protein GJ496_001720 [Pomphorhynchus laevis]